jgi:hypothetical protein
MEELTPGSMDGRSIARIIPGGLNKAAALEKTGPDPGTTGGVNPK